MKKTGIVITALFAVMMAACGGTVENKPANVANTNANTAVDQGPTVAMLKELETKAFEAYKNKDTKYFETFLAANFVSFSKGQKHDRAATLKMIGEHKDELKGFTFSEERISKLNPNAAVLTMKVATDGTVDGKKPSDAISSTLYVKEGTAWKAAWHSEVDYVTPPAQTDRSSAAKTDDKAKSDDKAVASDKASDSAKAKPEAQKDSDDAADAKATDSKSAATKPADTKPANSSSGTTATSMNDAAADQFTALEKTGWETWKAKDWAKLGGMMVSEVMFVDPMGGIMAGKDAVIKGFTAMNCEVKSTSITDGQSVSLSGDLAILYAKGDADAKCGDTKLSPVWVTAIYVKEGADWKLGYHFEQPRK
jgi:ketosteroid isomerase-like protein